MKNIKMRDKTPLSLKQIEEGEMFRFVEEGNSPLVVYARVSNTLERNRSGELGVVVIGSADPLTKVGAVYYWKPDIEVARLKEVDRVHFVEVP